MRHVERFVIGASPGGTGFASTVLNVDDKELVTVEAVWSGFDAFDGSITFERSLDGETWEEILTCDLSLRTASGVKSQDFCQPTYAKLRANWIPNSVTAGLITLTARTKNDRP